MHIAYQMSNFNNISASFQNLFVVVFAWKRMSLLHSSLFLYWNEMSNFTMCIQFIALVPSALVLWTVRTCACGKPFPKIVPMAKLHSLLACAFILSTYNNLLLKAKNQKIKSKASFHHSRQITFEWFLFLMNGFKMSI